MHPRGTSQQEAVARRLELLGAELDAVRGAAPPAAEPGRPAGEPAHPVAAAVELPVGARPHHADTPAVPVEPPGETLAVPVPGRHAARRASYSAVGALRGRVGLSAGQVAVVAVLVALGMALAAWWLVRGRPEPIAPVAGAALVTPSPLPGAADAAAPSAAASAPDVVVDVAGKVRRPGIVVLEAGARVVDALEAAGGARRGVDLTGLNLARVLVDGEQVLVGEAAAGTVAAPPPGSAGTSRPLVNLNTADTSALEALPGVGPVTAQAIVDWRAENGAFASADQLLDVSGIGEATLADLLPHVTVG